MRSFTRFLGAASAVALIAGALDAQSTQTLPAGFDSAFGGSGTAYPFNSSNRHKWHWVYDSSNFSATFPILIHRIEIRSVNGNAWPAVTYENFEMLLGASQNDYTVGNYNQVFDNNWAPATGSPHVFFQGNLSIPAGGPAGPTTWSISVPGNTPFLYDPTQGNDFIIQLRTPAGASGSNPSLHTTDGTSGQAGQNGGNRYGSTSDPNATSYTFNNNEFVPIAQITYTPATGLYASFNATPTSGASPLTAAFSDTTFTSDPGGVTSWTWDLDGDGITDSFAQNPSFTYNTCGYYDVTLTVTDATHPPSTLTKTQYITIDPQRLVTADFTAAPLVGPAPLSVSFTDASSGSPTAWAWDFDNDGVIDSTLRNPTHSYAAAGWYDVKLTASNSCGGHSETKTAFVNVVGATSNTLSAEILHYQLNEPRGNKVFNTASTTLAPEWGTVSSPNWQADPGRPGFMANESGFGCLGIKTASPYSVINSGWPIDFQGSHTVMFWQRWNGSGSTAYAFGSGTGSSGRAYWTGGVFNLYSWGTPAIPTVISATDTRIPNVWSHIALVIDDGAGTGQWYFNGLPDGSASAFAPGSFRFQGGNFLIGSYSSGTSSPFSRYFEMDDFRVYSRALNANEVQGALLREPPAAGRFDAGCAGPSGVPVIGTSGGAPTPGNANFAVTLSGAEASRAALLVMGVHVDTWLVVLPLPFSLDFLYGPGSGCGLQTGIEATYSANTGAGSLTVPSPLPPGFYSGHGYAQWILLGTTGAVSEGLSVNIHR